jgi:hypothetical protein
VLRVLRPPTRISHRAETRLGAAGRAGLHRPRKLRYEIVPGFQTTAILYEPLNLGGC